MAVDPIMLHTPRLRLRRATLSDAPFILELLNDPDWLRNIGDKQVRTLDDARRYLEQGPLAMYRNAGRGLMLVESASQRTPMGLCGLLRRETLPDPDIGFAFLPAFRGSGYAHEAAAVLMEHARSVMQLRRILAITTQDNRASQRLLERLGLRHERDMRMAADAELLRLYAWDAAATAA